MQVRAVLQLIVHALTPARLQLMERSNNGAMENLFKNFEQDMAHFLGTMEFKSCKLFWSVLRWDINGGTG